MLALAGPAFALSGPSAILAFALNGFLAVLTALSFAELATAFPESGGAYVFARKVLSIRAAFAAGWILWFAYIAAGALYALGFAVYADLALQAVAPRVSDLVPEVALIRGLGIGAVAFYAGT